MASSDNATFQLLLEQIKKMNENLEASSFAINNLTMEINRLDLPIAVPAIPTANANGTPSLDGDGDVANGNAPNPRINKETKKTRSLGYVNWESPIHDELKTYKLVKMNYLRTLLNTMLTNLEQNKQRNQNNRAITQSSYANQSSQSTSFRHFAGLETASNYMEIDEEIRFPLDAVYINVESPAVKKELDFMDKLNVMPTDGVLDRFKNIIEEEKLTCASFEKKYGLKWE